MAGMTSIKTIQTYCKAAASGVALGVLGLGLLVCSIMPSIEAVAQSSNANGPKTPKTPETKGVSDVVRAINGPRSDVGMVMLFHYDGEIETFGVQRGTDTENRNGPPAQRTTLGEMMDVEVETYEYNPNCITWKQGGTYYTVCR